MKESSDLSQIFLKRVWTEILLWGPSQRSSVAISYKEISFRVLPVDLLKRSCTEILPGHLFWRSCAETWHRDLLQRSYQKVSYINLAKRTLLESLYRRFHKEILCRNIAKRFVEILPRRPLQRSCQETSYRALVRRSCQDTSSADLAQRQCQQISMILPRVSYIHLAKRAFIESLYRAERSRLDILARGLAKRPVAKCHTCHAKYRGVTGD